MLELSDRSRWLVGAVASTAAVSLWLARRRQFSAAVQAPGEPLSTSFEAYLKQAPPEPVQYATTSFEAYLKQPPTAAAAAAAAAAPSSIADSLQAPPSAKPVTILFGTEYGFSKEVAERAGEALAAVDGGAAFWPQLLDMADLEGGLPSLASCQALLLVCSTQGDGVPPTEARPFCDWLASAAAPQLAATPFSVCALGDKSYQHFCRCGRTLDARLEALGGKRLAARADINREDFAAIDGWVESVCSALATLPLKTLAELGGTAALAAPAAEGGAAPAKRWSRSRPYMGRLVAVEGLCRLVSADDKNTVRVEVDLGDSGLQYLPGDALGIWPSNCPEAVDELLEVMGVDGKLQVQVPCWHYDDAVLPANATSMPLRDALARCYDLRQPKPELLHLLHARLAALHTQQQEQHAPLGTNSGNRGSDGGSAGLAKGGHGKPGRLGLHHVKDKDSASELSGGDAAAATQGELCAQGCIVDRLERLAALVADPEAAEAYLRPRHLVDVLADCGGLPLGLGAAELLCTLRQLQPRLYSISSSQLEHPQRVQATIALVRYDSLGAVRIGVCSTFVGERLEEGQQVPVYIHKNPDFRLPADPATPIIMVGPGTGLAPFRSFMQDRLLRAQEGGAPPCGPCLLYFGCRRRDQDYLYGQQLEEWAAQGKLTLFTAFSREQAEKVYVQDRLAQSGPQVWDLLEHAGAHFYVCGDAGSMAGAVERQLLAIIEQGQGQGREAAQAYLQRLSDSGRYQRDVWLS